MAEERLVQFGIISASNLKDVNYISKMETYAVLTFPPYVEYTTQVDSKGGLNPRWDEKLGFLVPEEVLSQGKAHLKVEIFTLSTLGPKFVAEADIPVADLTVSTHFKEPVSKRYPLKTSSGDYHGDVHVSFALGEKVVLTKGERPEYPIVTRFSPQAPSPYPTPPGTTEPPLARPKPTPHFEPTLPLVVRDGDATLPPSYAVPLSTKPLRPPPQPTTTFTKPSPYGPPYVEGDPTTYPPTKPPRASVKFGSHGYDDPAPRGDEPGLKAPSDRSGYFRGDDYGTKGTKSGGASRIDAPIASMSEGTAMYGYQPPATDFNRIFGSPIGKRLLTELSKTAPYGSRY